MLSSFGTKYISIDKTIINFSNDLEFDLYTKNDQRESILVYKKNTQLSKDLTQRLTLLSLYIDEADKELYEKHSMMIKFNNDKMNKLYNQMNEEISKLISHPQSLQDIEKIQENVTVMVDDILNNDHEITLLLSIMPKEFTTDIHSLNVSVLSIFFGKFLGIKQKLLQNLGTAALLHDIGKCKIDSKILNKEDSLTDEEFKHVQKHSLYSWQVLKELGVKDENILQGVKSHHEKVDGSGYPDKLKGHQIHRFGKIIAICDVFDALTSKCSYKDAFYEFNSLLLMKKQMPNHFDETLLNKFILMFKSKNGI